MNSKHQAAILIGLPLALTAFVYWYKPQGFWNLIHYHPDTIGGPLIIVAVVIIAKVYKWRSERIQPRTDEYKGWKPQIRSRKPRSI